MAITIEDLLNMQAQPRQAVSAEVPAILAAMMANRQQGAPELPNMPGPIQPIALPQLGDGGGHGGGGAGLAQQAISSLMGEYFQGRADDKKTKAESEQAKLLAQYAPQLYDARIEAERDPRAREQLIADRAALASGNSILAKTGLKNYEAYLPARMSDINASETIKNVRAETGQEGTPEFQAAMRQELQQKNAPTGMYRNERGELAFSPLAGGGTYQDIQDRISPLERSRLAIAQAQAARQEEAAQRADINQERQLGQTERTVKSQTAGLENTLRDEFGQRTATHRIVVDSYNKLNSVLGNEKASPAQTMSGIYAFMRMNDPSSTVRETEFAQAAKAGDFGDQIQNAVNRTLTGEGLTQEQRKDFTSTARNLLGASASQAKQHYDYYSEIAKEQGLNPKHVVQDVVGSEKTSAPKPQLTPEQALEMLKKNGARFQ